MTQEEINEVQWNSLPEWQKRQLYEERREAEASRERDPGFLKKQPVKNNRNYYERIRI